MAAEQGLADSQYNLGRMYYKGVGVKKDYKKAIQWYEAAILAGNIESQYALALMYYNGEGIEQDQIKALAMLHEAREQKHQ